MAGGTELDFLVYSVGGKRRGEAGLFLFMWFVSLGVSKKRICMARCLGASTVS